MVYSLLGCFIPLRNNKKEIVMDLSKAKETEMSEIIESIENISWGSRILKYFGSLGRSTSGSAGVSLTPVSDEVINVLHLPEDTANPEDD
jgi:hypothetical protein